MGENTNTFLLKKFFLSPEKNWKFEYGSYFFIFVISAMRYQKLRWMKYIL